MRLRLIFILSIFVMSALASTAREAKNSFYLNFRQSKVNLDTAYMNNIQELKTANSVIQAYNHPDSTMTLIDVNVVGGASPEGSVKFNEWLSHERANRIFDYLRDKMNVPDSLTSFTFLGRDWRGLRELVEADPDVPYRHEVIDMLDDIIEKVAGGEDEGMQNLNRVKRLRGGQPYLYMYRKQFPILRKSKLTLTFGYPVNYVEPEPVVPVIEEPEVVVPPCIPDTIVIHDTIYIDRVVYVERPLKPFYMGIKTNMLFDALAVPNIGAEFYLGKNMSIVGNWMYGWWKTDRRHRYWRIYGGDLALRYWFGKAAHEKPLTGHHVGVYGGIVTYDFEWGGTGYMGGIPRGTLWDRCNHYFGLEYGYSHPIGRRLNIDFTIGLGYLGGEYQVYDPVDKCYVYRETRRRHYWGPTKAEISLVWLIGRGNYNKKFDKKLCN